MIKKASHLARFALAAPLAFGCHGALVGGECIEGFVEEAGRCVVDPSASSGGNGGSNGGSNGGAGGSGGSTSTSTPTTTTTTSTTGSTTTTATSSTGEGSTGSGVVCTPLTYCAPSCVDLEDDPDNCGACGRYCPSGICTDGACEGAPGGHAVFAGFDYGRAQQAMPRIILRNALMLSGRDPLRVLDVCSADAGIACDTVRSVLVQVANDAGRSIVIAPRTLIGTALTPHILGDMDLVVVHHVMRDEVTQADAMTPLGPLLGDFAASGRTVIALGDETYTDGLSELFARSGLVSVSGVAESQASASVVDFFDALTSGVLSPFAQSGAATALTLVPAQDPLVRVVATNDAGAVLVHRVFVPSP